MSPRSVYPLAALEQLRSRLVDEARGELARVVAEQERAAHRCGEARGRLREAAERRRAAELRSSGGAAADVEGYARWVARLRRDEQELGGEAARLEEAAARVAERAERRRARLVEAERQQRTVERHRELWEAERRRAILRAEEAELELAARPGAPHRST